MEAKLEDDDVVNEGYVITFVTDNRGVEHEITFEQDSGDLVYHGQDGYPDKASQRTPEGNEHVEQAREYAKYYVYTQRGCETLPAYENPDRIAAVLLAIQALSEDAVEDLFGDLRKQLLSRHDESVEPVIEEPADPEYHHINYRQNVYLEEALQDISANFHQKIEHILPDLDDNVDITQLFREKADTIGPLIRESANEPDVSFSDIATIDAVSDVHVVYSGVTTSGEETISGDDPYDREPDARLELWPLGPPRLENFKNLLKIHLLCQLRDCYICMGVEPPEQYKILGPGLWKGTKAYSLDTDFYERYHVMDEDVEGYYQTVKT